MAFERILICSNSAKQINTIFPRRKDTKKSVQYNLCQPDNNGQSVNQVVNPMMIGIGSSENQ